MHLTKLSIPHRFVSCLKHWSRPHPAVSKFSANFVSTATPKSSSPCLSVERVSSGHVLVLGLNRPEARNALNAELRSALNAAVANLRADRETRVVVIRSQVKGAFCAGADLKERKGMSVEETRQTVVALRNLMTSIEQLPMPVIAAIDGFALGGGLELALACDLRVASSSAKLGLVETSLAIIPGAGGTQRLPRIIGMAKAKELVFTAKIIDGQEAYEMNLVNAVSEQNSSGDAAFQQALEMAERIVPNGPIGVRMAKIAINKGMETDIGTGLAMEEACYAQILATQDRLEGLKAFAEKRPPVYKGE